MDTALNIWESNDIFLFYGQLQVNTTNKQIRWDLIEVLIKTVRILRLHFSNLTNHICMYIIKNFFCRINKRGLGAPSTILERLKKNWGKWEWQCVLIGSLKGDWTSGDAQKLIWCYKVKISFKKVKAWPLCLGMIRGRIASQKLEKMTSSTVEPMKAHGAIP